MRTSRKIFCTVLIVLFTAYFNFHFIQKTLILISNAELSFDIKTENNSVIQMFYGTDSWSEELSVFQTVNTTDFVNIRFPVYSNYRGVRIDFGNIPQKIILKNIKIISKYKTLEITEEILKNSITQNNSNQIDSYIINSESATFVTSGDDGYFTISFPNSYLKFLPFHTTWPYYTKVFAFLNIFLCILVDVVILFFIIKFPLIGDFIFELFQNRKLLIRLSYNDFKTKYAGSSFGIFWAFVQPVVTVLIFIFVFQIAFKTQPVNNFPFALWLIAGFVPWFFFSDAWVGGTNSFTDYTYLVKKVVFKISILPMVKVSSALIVHIFFIIFTLLIYSINGFFPTIYTVQVLYYTFATYIYALALSYITCSLIVFFKDLGQIVSIILQVVNWLTPIMWNFDNINLPSVVKLIFMANPLYYIVNGYRDSLINHVFFWQRDYLTVYFWCITSFLMFVGMWLYKKLKIHFADVL